MCIVLKLAKQQGIVACELVPIDLKDRHATKQRTRVVAITRAIGHSAAGPCGILNHAADFS